MTSKIIHLSLVGLFFMSISYLITPVKKMETEKQNEAITKTSAKGPNVPSDYFLLQRAGKDGVIDNQRYRNARSQFKHAMQSRSFSELNDRKWQLRGPSNTGGRVTDIIGSPTNADLFYVASASGGVFKTSNGGQTFTPIFDNAGSLSIGALALDPNDSNILYVGTGEANPGGGSVTQPGDGLWRSNDGGSTWEHLGLSESINIGTIDVDKNNSDIIFVAVTGNLFEQSSERGVYRSTDKGQTWQLVHSISTKTGAIDVRIDPNNSNRIFAVMWERYRHIDGRKYGGKESGIWRSENGGDAWQQLTNGLPSSNTEPGRIGIDISESSSGTLYATYGSTTGTFNGLYRSTNNGTSWTKLNGSGLSGVCGGYCWWFGNVWVNPSDVNDIWVDGVSLKRSTNGGNSFSSVTGMHVDHHAQWWSPSQSNLVLKGNDGGLYKSTNGGNSWNKLANLPITQFYAIEIHPTDHNKISGGTQDNGTIRGTNLSNWSGIYGGDGFTTLYDPVNPSYVYAESQWANLGRSTNGGQSFSYATSGFTGRKPWHGAYTIDPNNTQTLYFGSHTLHRSTNRAQSWSSVTGDLTNGDQGSGGVVFGTISEIQVAPSNSNVIYVGTDDGNVWRVDKNQNMFTPTSISNNLPTRWVTAIAVSPSNESSVVVTFSGFHHGDYASHVFHSINGGQSWTDISGNLPNAPVNDILIDSKNEQVLYAANDLGVYISTNNGSQWAPLGTGMPSVVVSDLKLKTSATKQELFAGTYGRSIYSVVLDEVTTPDDVITLKDGETYSGLTLTANSWQHFKLSVPSDSNFSKLNITTSANNGDADLYVRKSIQPDKNNYDCRSISSNSNESCTINNPSSDTYRISVLAYNSFNALSITANLIDDSNNGETYQGNLAKTGDENIQPNGSWFQYSGGQLSAELTGPTNTDFDLYLDKWNGKWEEVKKSTSPSSKESIQYTAASGYYRFRVKSYQGSGDYIFLLAK